MSSGSENLIFEYDPGWEEELAEINLGKNGAPFLYTDDLIMLAAAFRNAFRTVYRQLSGVIKRILVGHKAPAYNTLYRRMQKLGVKINNGKITVHDKSMRLTLIYRPQATQLLRVDTP